MTGADGALRLARATERLPDYLALLEALVVQESPTGDEARNRALADFIAAEMARRGARVERHAAAGFGEHLVARFQSERRGERKGERKGEPPLLVAAHMDTVHPVGTLARYPFRVDGPVVRGPGSYDMKAGIAMVLGAMDVLESLGERPHAELTLLVTCDEEVGSANSRALIEEHARGARAALIVEPCATGGKVKARRKGVAWYRTVVRGRPAHAGVEPEAGASAIHELARLTLRMLELEDRPAGTTLNVGVIGGGTRRNVVAEEAFAHVDVRCWTPEEFGRVDAALRALVPHDPGCTLHVEGEVDRAPLEQTPESDRLFELAREEAEGLGFELERTGTGGASDGNLTSGAGCPTLDGLGPDGGGAHTLEEHVLLADVPRRVALLAGLLRRI